MYRFFTSSEKSFVYSVPLYRTKNFFCLNNYGEEVMKQLKAGGIRVEMDNRSEKLSYKIREARLDKVPYMIILGDMENQNNTVSVILHDADKVYMNPRGEDVRVAASTLSRWYYNYTRNGFEALVLVKRWILADKGS